MMSYKYNVLKISNLCKRAENLVFATLWASVGVEMLNLGDACGFFSWAFTPVLASHPHLAT